MTEPTANHRTATPDVVTGDPTRPPGQLRRFAATAVVCLGLFLLGMDLTLLNVAVPDLQRGLGASTAQVEWVVDGYALVLGGTVLTSGAVTDRIGRRRSFVCGLAVCGTAAVPGALAHAPGLVIASRCGMGAGAALLMPATLSIITTLFPEPDLRRRALALWAAVGGIGGMVGPVIGGWLVQDYSWRAGFWVTVPIAAIVIVLALLVVPESRAPRAERIDFLGATLSAAGLLALVWAIIESPTAGWTSPAVLAAFIAAGLLLAAFAVWQTRAPAPMLPVELLRPARVSMGAAALALLSFALFGTLFVTTLYLQGVLGYTPWQAGVRTLPLPGGLAVGAMVAVPLVAWLGDKTAIVLGLVVAAAALAILADTSAGSGYGHLVVVLSIAGIGAGISAVTATETVMSAVPSHRAGLGSAINDATRQVGSALGVAVQGSILAAVYPSRLHTLLTGSGAPAPLELAAQHSALDARSAASRLPDNLRDQFVIAAREAFVHAMTTTAMTAGAVTLAAAVAACYWLPHRGAPPVERSSARPSVDELTSGCHRR